MQNLYRSRFPHRQEEAIELPSAGKQAKECRQVAYVKMIYCEKMALCLRISFNWKKYISICE